MRAPSWPDLNEDLSGIAMYPQKPAVFLRHTYNGTDNIWELKKRFKMTLQFDFIVEHQPSFSINK
jgi:hypothetical protein